MKTRTILILMAISAIIPILIYSIRFGDFPLSDDPSKWGDFGDYLSGTAGVLLGFLSVVLVLQTLKSQNKNFERQQFDTSFFNWLTIQREIMNGVEFNETTTQSGVIKRSEAFLGIRGFIYFNNSLYEKHREQENGGDWNTFQNDWKSCYKYTEFRMNHYFGNLLQICIWIEKSNVDDSKSYFTILKSQFFDS